MDKLGSSMKVGGTVAMGKRVAAGANSREQVFLEDTVRVNFPPHLVCVVTVSALGVL